MKLSNSVNKPIIFTLMTSVAMKDCITNAFVVSSTSSHSSTSEMSSVFDPTITTTTTTTTTSTFTFQFLEGALEEPIPVVANDSDDLKRMKFSKAVPILPRPPLLDGTMPGDVGFDPLQIAKSKADLEKYRESEVKHGRLAMLAAVGWPISELYDEKIAQAFDLPTMLDQYGRAPSFLNGFGEINIAYWVGVLGFAALVDSYGIHFKSQISDQRRSADPDLYFPGNLGFDPLGLYPKDMISRKVLQLAEIKHGRVAMMAVLIYALQESITKSSILGM